MESYLCIKVDVEAALWRQAKADCSLAKVEVRSGFSCDSGSRTLVASSRPPALPNYLSSPCPLRYCATARYRIQCPSTTSPHAPSSSSTTYVHPSTDSSSRPPPIPRRARAGSARPNPDAIGDVPPRALRCTPTPCSARRSTAGKKISPPSRLLQRRLRLLPWLQSARRLKPPPHTTPRTAGYTAGESSAQAGRHS